jgi:glutathione synthase/RimK-type ligase-like ATP-grasp enzyme
MILVCGGLADPVTELVCARLRDSCYPYRLLDLATYPAGFRLNWHWQGDCPTGYITSDHWRLDLSEISVVYIRYLGPEDRIKPPNLPREFVPAFSAECDLGLAALFESLPCPVVNRERGGISNHSKPYQALQIRHCGLRTPLTLLTSDPVAARQFYEECEGQVIYKSISGVRSIVRRMTAEHLARLPFLENGPAQFQAFIPGDDIRVHTVGDRWFATRIRSRAVDYRYAYEEGFFVEMQPTALPTTVASACLRVARQFGLLFAGIDLKETPDGNYYCFEVNPSPGFLVYEQCGGQPISQALAELLNRGQTRSIRIGESSAG